MTGPPFELVIFDNDGVLVDSEDHAQLVTAGLLTGLGVPMTPADCRANFLGKSLRDIRAWSERRRGRALPARFEAEFHAELFERFRGRIFSAEDVSRGKPAPDLFLHAARSLRAEPARCAVIEDSRTGVTAGNAAGMTVFGFARVTPAAELAHASGGVFTSMSELPALLGCPLG